MTKLEDARARFAAKNGAAKPASTPSPEPARPKQNVAAMLGKGGGSTGIDPAAMRTARGRGGRFTLDRAHDDATIGFGKYSGTRVSVLANDEEGRGYLRWMLTQEFPEALLEIVRHALDSTPELGGRR